MPSCIVKGCKHHTSMKSSSTLLSMHVFPRELGRIKLWLQHTGQDFGDTDAFAARILDAAKSGKYRICSAHFDPGCYTTVGCRLVLKHDAVPTVFPGVYPKPSPNWKPFSPHARRAHLDVTGAYSAGGHENAAKVLRKDAATQTSSGQDKARPTSLNTSLMERCNKQEEIFDASGRLVGVFSPDSRQRDLKVRPGLWTYDWSTQVPKEPSKTHPPMENKEALSSLEKVLLSLLKHMSEAPHSRPQKQRTNRLLNRTAEIISILTGEEWTVVKKNAHISKFYQMIREVPIKCGDVAMFFTMEEWEYIEEHEDLYKPVMLENPKDAKDAPPHTGSGGGGGQDKAPVSREQPSANTDRSAGKKRPPEISPDCRRTPIAPGADCKLLRNVPDKRSVTPERPERRRSSVSDAAAHTAERRESLKNEEEEADPSCRRSSTGDAHHTKDEEFIKKENEDTDMAKNSTEPRGDPPPRKDPPPAEVVHRCGMRIDSRQSMRSELWIAQDGTTSSRFIPQDVRPPGWTHKTYSRKPLPLQCPIGLSSNAAPDGSGSDQTGSKRGAPGNERCCDQCNKQFPDTYQLAAHQKLHTKKPRR